MIQTDKTNFEEDKEFSNGKKKKTFLANILSGTTALLVPLGLCLTMSNSIEISCITINKRPKQKLNIFLSINRFNIYTKDVLNKNYHISK